MNLWAGLSGEAVCQGVLTWREIPAFARVHREQGVRLQ